MDLKDPFQAQTFPDSCDSSGPDPVPQWAMRSRNAVSCISCGKTSLSKSHHLISILKAEIQDELATEGRLRPTDVPTELDKPGMRSFTAPVPSGTEQTGFYCSLNWGIFHRHHNPPENHLKQLLLHESTLEKSVPSSGVSSKPTPAKAHPTVCSLKQGSWKMMDKGIPDLGWRKADVNELVDNKNASEIILGPAQVSKPAISNVL